MTARFWWVLLIFFSVTVCAETPAESLAKIRSRLMKHSQVQGQFHQTRFVKELDLRLESSGQFQFKLPLDLHWNQKKPFVMDLLMTPEKMVQTQADGSHQTITAKEQPILFAFSSSFLGVFSGDEKKISQNFKYKVLTLPKQRWRMDLEPKDETFKKAIRAVQITGSDFVESVEVTEMSGNTNLIRFSGVQGN